jgi:hypothetical protein
MQRRVGPFRLDQDQACLWHGDERVMLRPKALSKNNFTVLRRMFVQQQDGAEGA